MATLQLGRLEEFQPEEDSIASYLERIQLYFIANDTDRDKVPVFLSTVGARTYSLLCDLLAPAKLKDQTFQTLAETLKDHFEPKKKLSLLILLPPKKSSARRDSGSVHRGTPSSSDSLQLRWLP